VIAELPGKRDGLRAHDDELQGYLEGRTERPADTRVAVCCPQVTYDVAGGALQAGASSAGLVSAAPG
jgi:hypothetical protein